MGKRYVKHSDLCGCERCAIQADREYPQPVYDAIDDDDYDDQGIPLDWEPLDDFDEMPDDMKD